MKFEFKAKGHRNITCSNSDSIAFTTDNFLTKGGNNYLGVSATSCLIDLEEFKKVVKKSKFRVTITADNVSEEIIAYGNMKLKLSDPTEIAIRKSSFIDEKTLGVHANKGAADLDPNLIEKLKIPGVEIVVTIEPIDIKAVLFDLDDTLIDMEAIGELRYSKVKSILKKEFKDKVDDIIAEFKKVDRKYIGKSLDPKDHLREKWFEEAFANLNLKGNTKLYEKLTKAYWDVIISKVKLLPDAKALLKKLKKMKLAVAIVTDGQDETKMKKLKKLGILKAFNTIITSQKVNQNKPGLKMFEEAADILDVPEENCIMVGDKPNIDLEPAKKLNMTTIWMIHGHWANESEKNKEHHDYVDFSTKQLKDVLAIIESLNH